MRVLRVKKRANTLCLHLCLPKGVDLNIHPSQPLDRHPGDIPAGQTLVVVMTMEVVAVAVAEDHLLGETLAMIQTWMTIQVLTIIQKWIEKGIALPFVVLLHQQDMTGTSLIHVHVCLAGTQIPPAYECSANISLKCATTCSEAGSTKQFGTPLMTYLDVHPSPQGHMHILKPL
jgi:hypothetical protein